MPYKDPASRKEADARYRAANREKKKQYYERNKGRENEADAKRREDRKQNAYDSITSGIIIDRHKWNVWCNQIKSSNSKHPYSDDFTNDIMFEMMLQGCFYCGNFATTIDRIDSKLEHTLDNCVGSCYGCNNSKGAADPSTFIRKAYYRARGKYYDDDTDIWFVIYKRKPRIDMMKSKANKQGVSFDLTKNDVGVLVKGDCEYCKRSPTTWFGVDRVVPSLGYVLGNVVSCCWDCNLDKLDDDVESVIARNERIAKRVDAGELIITEYDKVILHTGRE